MEIELANPTCDPIELFKDFQNYLLLPKNGFGTHDNFSIMTCIAWLRDRDQQTYRGLLPTKIREPFTELSTTLYRLLEVWKQAGYIEPYSTMGYKITGGPI